jgi:methylglutaconyl-CoA hydratase
VCPPESLDSKVHEIANALTLGGPQALAQTKVLLAMVNARSVDSTLIEQTAKFIASVRASTEGKEGVSSFLEKRAPAWASMS